MNRGYISVVQNNEDVDYLRLAYALSLSMRRTQTEISDYSIITDIDVPEKYRKAFDKIIPIKNDRATDVNWKLHNIVDVYDYTPYEETVLVDCDMLFLTDIGHWWNKLQERNMWFTTHTRTYYNTETSKYSLHRKEFVNNKLPNVYCGFFYFKKCDETKELFETVKIICDNWDFYSGRFLSNQKPKMFSTDVAFALAIKLLGIKDDVTSPLSFPYFTHMKTSNNDMWPYYETLNEDWTEYACIDFDKFNNSLGIKIGSIRQFGVLHYHIKDFLNDEMIKILEDRYD